MSSIEDFNRIDDCNKISPDCVDAEFRVEYDDNRLCFYTSWGDVCIDTEEIVKDGETCTKLYLSPEDDPNCLVYEAECGETYCITGDDLSGIISMHLLKDVDKTVPPADGDIYMWDDETNQFKVYHLGDYMQQLKVTLDNMQQNIQNIQERLTPPEGAPQNVKVVFGNINDYSDPNVEVEEGSGSISKLSKEHGFYSHSTKEDWFGDEVFG